MRLLCFFLVVLAALVPTGAVTAAPRCFPGIPSIADCIDGRFREFWEHHGGLPVFGYPIGPAATSDTAAGPRLAQRFERVRFELHPENAHPYDVLLGRLGAEALARRGIDLAALPRVDPSTPHYFPETGQAIAPEFWSYWSSHGLEFDGRPGTAFAESLALFGLPLTPATPETNPTDGQVYLTQWFERARFEYHPAHAGTPAEVQLGLLEREAGGTHQTQAGLPQGGFLAIDGERITFQGQPIQLKGVNYYPQGRPWADMWDKWDGPQIARELRLARDHLGINAIRVLLPYEIEGADAEKGQVSTLLLTRLRELVQIAGDLDIRVIVTLFDFYDGFPAPGTRDYERNLAYVRTLVGNFAGDDRIIGWDLHNEPDNYKTWLNGESARVLAWLGHMADEVHQLAPDHFVTVGMAKFDNLLMPGPDGRRPIDYSDIVSAHIYDRYAVTYQLDVLRQHTARPIVLEEFGWPTALSCVRRIYNEEYQTRVYRDTLAAVDGRVAGVFAWTLRDFDPGPTRRWDHHEEHYGLFRANDTLKPAAEIFRRYPATPLPSIVDTDLPLSSTGPYLEGGEFGALAVPGTPYYVKSWFRRAWDFLSGPTSFGPPIGEALIIPGPTPREDRVVQYFYAGALEFNRRGLNAPNFALLTEAEQAQLAVVPLDVTLLTGADSAPQEGADVASRFRGFYDGISGEWRLGPPTSPERIEQVNGQPTPVQYFRRGRLQVNPVSGVVELGNIGELAFEAFCRNAPE